MKSMISKNLLTVSLALVCFCAEAFAQARMIDQPAGQLRAEAQRMLLPQLVLAGFG